MPAQAPQPAWLECQGRRLAFDAAAAHSLALELDFDGRAPQWFGAPAPACNALRAGSFNGRVSAGASCNASTFSLTPHCDGTHTEGVGHLTRERHDARDAVPAGYVAALLVTVTPSAAGISGESARPAPRHDDLLITQQALAAAWPQGLPFAPAALIVRTLPNGDAKRTRDYTRQGAAYLSLQAAQFLVARGILHLVLDVPSADRADDDGQLGAHRVFFGLEPGASALASARRPQCTITELAYVPDALADGPWLMQLQIPALAGDALPSRPLLYRLLDA
jgi:kynurenine formamidase